MAKDRLLTELAEALLTDYSVVYHVNATTGEYHWFSYDPAFYTFNSDRDGSDFFGRADRMMYEDKRRIKEEEPE